MRPMAQKHRTSPPARLALVAALALATTALASSWLAAPPAAAQQLEDDPTVRGIEIEGLARIDKQAVKAKIYTQIGRSLDRGRLSEDLKRVYAMGFFDDIQIVERDYPDDEGIILTFILVERPTMTEIVYDIDGDAVDKDEVQQVVDLKPLEILDEARIRKNLSKIADLYVEEGHFLVDTSYRLEDMGDKGKRVVIVVREGQKVEVRRVEIVGNRALTSEEIEAVMATREGGWFSFLTQSGEFKKELFEQDLQRIQYLYLTKGYIQIDVSDPVVTLSPDRASMEIVIRVKEGPRFKVGDIDLEMTDGEWVVDKATLKKRLALKTGDWFDYSVMQADTQYLSGAYKDRGFANANVASAHDVDPDALTFGVTFKIQKGDPVFIRRIEIRGNKDTRDKVVRREMKINEGELYSGDKIRRSQRRIMALGFFEPPSRPGDNGGVVIETRPTGDPRTIDLVVTVKEKQTGTFQIGAGFSSLESFILTVQISKENFLGRGHTASFNATFSGLRRLFSLSFYEPYFFDTPVTFAIDLYNFQEDFTDFTRLRSGGSLSFGYRLTDDLSISLSSTLEDVDATLRRTDIDIAKLRQEGFTSSLRTTLSYDTRDNRIFPTSGQYTTLSLELAHAALGSENEFWRVLGRTRWYFPLFWEFVLRLNGTAGVVQGLNGEPVPLFERFFVGGIFTVRGFERNSIGEQLYLSSLPDGTLSPVTIGGTRELIFNAELEFPIFKEVGIKGVVFFDAGNAWGNDVAFDPFDLRTSVGFGFRWNSPVGPLRFEWGFPLSLRDGERSAPFEFTIGNSF
ncbi:MAG: outer membrane protein assembly factor BamA [Deltaproteobacteria bacterium]|nr:outer membrane protein assembly factor BamA [Deltaproteobacteria bacterium]